jgi:hypothetical protein
VRPLQKLKSKRSDIFVKSFYTFLFNQVILQMCDFETVGGHGGGVKDKISGFKKWGNHNESISRKNPFNRDYDGQ